MTQAPPQSTAIVRVNPAAVPIALQTFGDEERLMVLKEQLGRGWKRPMEDAELEHIALVVQRTRLDPLARPPQIYFIQRYDSALKKFVMTPQTSIDGARLTAARTHEYLGQVGPEWSADGETWKTVWLSNEPPAAARVGVLRKGFKEPIWSVAVWSRAAQFVDQWQNDRVVGKKLAPFWEKMGAEMLAKTAEFNAIKRAFPAETNELELAHLEELHRLEVPARAAEYDRIFGSEQAGTAFSELPAAYQAPRERNDLEDREVIEHDGRTVDAQSGEVLDPGDLGEGGWAPDVNSGDSPAPTPPIQAPQPAVGGRPVSPKMVESIDDPLYQLYADRYHEAIRLKIEADIIVLPETVVKVTQMGKQLTAKINAAKLDAARKQRQEQAAQEPADAQPAGASEQLL